MPGLVDGAHAIVLGGAGFLGSQVVRRLVTSGARVTVIDSLAPGSGGNAFNLRNVSGCESHFTDVRSVDSFDALIASADVIVDAMGSTGHQWAYENPLADLDANLTAHLFVLDACRRSAKRPRYVLLSSRSIYGAATGRAIDESSPAEPTDLQGTHKLASEREFRLLTERLGMTCIALRLGNCYGPGQRVSGDDPGLFGGMVRDALHDQPTTVYGGPDRRRDFLFTDDAADAVLAAIGAPAEGFLALNVAGERASLLDLANLVVSAAGRGSVLTAPFPEQIKKLDPGDLLLDCGAAKRVLGWTPKTPIESGVEQTVRFYSEHAAQYGL